MARQHRHVPPLFKSQIAAAYKRGDPVAPIAKDFGVSGGYPSKLARKEGLEMRRPRKSANHDEGSQDDGNCN